MSSIINADTSNGLKITSDTSGEVKIQSAGSDIVTVTSSGVAVSGDLSVTGSTPGGFFTESVTFSTDTTVTSANAGKVYYTSTDNLTLTLPALPSGTSVLAYGVINDSDTDLILSTNTPASEYIGVWLGSATLTAKQEAIIVSVANGWKLIGIDANSSINIQQFTSSGTYTPEATVSSFLVCMGGAAGGSSSSYGSGGGGYSEKFYASPTGSYAIVLGSGGAPGSAGGTSTFNGSDISVSSNTAPNGGTATGGDWNVSGGTGGTTSGGRGGGGGAASRAGVGGNGASGTGTQAGAGGGTGGNNASSYTGGAAATTENASAYGLASLFNSFTFDYGRSVTQSQTSTAGQGADGVQSITLLDTTTDVLYGGRFGRQATSSGETGFNARCTIVEFKG